MHIAWVPLTRYHLSLEAAPLDGTRCPHRAMIISLCWSAYTSLSLYRRTQEKLAYEFVLAHSECLLRLS